VSADGSGIVSQAGALLLTQVLRLMGLGRQLPAGWSGGGRRGRCTTPGKIVAELAVALPAADSTQRRTHLYAGRT
jgi:hypothetical protein